MQNRIWKRFFESPDGRGWTSIHLSSLDDERGGVRRTVHTAVVHRESTGPGSVRTHSAAYACSSSISTSAGSGGGNAAGSDGNVTISTGRHMRRDS